MTVDAATQEGGDLNPSDHPELSPSELIDLRAAQRTYQGAWLRTSLANLGYAAVVLKVFDRRFFGIGLLYTLLSLALLGASLRRSAKTQRSILPPSSPLLAPRPALPKLRRSTVSGAQPAQPDDKLATRPAATPTSRPPRTPAVDPSTCDSGVLNSPEAVGGLQGLGSEREAFELAGPVILVFGLLVGALELALLGLVLRVG